MSSVGSRSAHHPPVLRGFICSPASLRLGTSLGAGRSPIPQRDRTRKGYRMSRHRRKHHSSVVYNPPLPRRDARAWCLRCGKHLRPGTTCCSVERVVVTCHDAPLTMSAAKVLERRLDRLIARGVVDLDPYILHHLGRGPDPDRKVRPRPHSNPWNTVE